MKSIKKLKEQAINAGTLHTAEEFGDYRDTWRVFRIMAELVEGYNFLAGFKKEVTIFGSARLSSENKYYKEAVKMGDILVKGGFTVITGGGPGIMEAANRGAYDGGGESVGLNIQMPFEQRINPYVKKSIAFYYFFTRKIILTSPANAFVFFPGGFGTMDEFFEVIDAMEQRMMTKSPVIMVGKEYWQPALDFLREKCCAEVGSVKKEQLDELHLVETAEEAYEYIKNVKEKMDPCDLSPNNFHCKGNIDWKIFKVMAELVEGFEFITGLKKAVTILGTKSLKPESHFYDAAYTLGQVLAKKDYSVVTGAKFGIAEAANKGAFEAGGVSLGIGMNVGKTKEMNPYLTKSIFFDFPFTRKLIVTAPTKAVVLFPGGLGTMHYLFEVLTLIQTKKIAKMPVILYNHEFWDPLYNFIIEVLVKNLKTIEKEDGELFQIVDSVGEIVDVIDDN